MALFLGIPGCADARRRNFFWTLWCKGEISEADASTICWAPLHPDQPATHLPHSLQIFTLDALPATTVPIYLGLRQHQTCWLVYPVAWLKVMVTVEIYLFRRKMSFTCTTNDIYSAHRLKIFSMPDPQQRIKCKIKLSQRYQFQATQPTLQEYWPRSGTINISIIINYQWATHFPRQNAPSYGEIWTTSNTIPWAHCSPHPKRHLDWFSHFARLLIITDRQRAGQTTSHRL